MTDYPSTPDKFFVFFFIQRFVDPDGCRHLDLVSEEIKKEDLKSKQQLPDLMNKITSRPDFFDFHPKVNYEEIFDNFCKYHGVVLKEQI